MIGHHNREIVIALYEICPRYTIKNTKQCKYQVKTTRSVSESGFGDAGGHAIIGAAEGAWDLRSGEHKGGNVRLVLRWKYRKDEQGEGIEPEKPGIYLKEPVVIKMGQLIKLT